MATDRRGFGERNVFVGPVVGAMPANRVEVEPLEVDEQLAQAIGVATHTNTPCEELQYRTMRSVQHQDNKDTKTSITQSRLLPSVLVSWWLVLIRWRCRAGSR